jgi:hypothetical protein
VMLLGSTVGLLCREEIGLAHTHVAAPDAGAARGR